MLRSSGHVDGRELRRELLAQVPVELLVEGIRLRPQHVAQHLVVCPAVAVGTQHVAERAVAVLVLDQLRDQ